MILDYLKKYEKGAIITSILLIIISIFLIAIPGIVLSTLVTVFGIIFFAEGLINIISYIFEDKEIRAFSNELILGIILLVFGLIILLNQVAFISILPIIIGMWLIIKSVMKFQLAINLKSMMAEMGLGISFSNTNVYIWCFNCLKSICNSNHINKICRYYASNCRNL